MFLLMRRIPFTLLLISSILLAIEAHSCKKGRDRLCKNDDLNDLHTFCKCLSKEKETSHFDDFICETYEQMKIARDLRASITNAMACPGRR